MRQQVIGVAVVTTFVMAGMLSSAFATEILGKRCLFEPCGGASDQACVGTMGCQFCNGTSAYKWLCFNSNNQSDKCKAKPTSTTCGTTQVGTCVNNVCSNSTGNGVTCTQNDCYPPPPPQ